MFPDMMFIHLYIYNLAKMYSNGHHLIYHWFCISVTYMHAYEYFSVVCQY